MADKDEQYQPKDTVTIAIKASTVTGTAGLFIAAVQNTLTRQRPTAWGVFTRGGGTILTFFAMGGLFELGRCSTANLRQKDSSINNAIGGMMAGSVLGLLGGSTAAVIGTGALTAVVMGTFEYTGGKLSGYERPKGVEFQSYMDKRNKGRRPIEETIAELGEGRGVYGPGYQERRRQRLKEKYGIDVPKDI